ncbi:interferon-induced very large GTPase 1-like [Diretmus argenteus]
MMLDGLPLELVDGEASNMPMNWVKAVLTELHKLTAPNNNIRVVSVLGVQSSGKSTLLNIMFGVQFAVSNGKCTRGAYMQLMKVKEDLRNQLGCDFLMVIDTEGLKSPELAELVDSHAHDNELATLVVGLSDITIINMSMENAAEMKDTLQIVGHAFLRMNQVGKKKPRCLFVHQNMASVAAHKKSAKDRMLLLQQLNEMIEIAARMEKKGNTKFTDIMAYDPEKDTAYIPNLWQGNPPMAPVNTGYCEAVDELKKRVLGFITENKSEVQSILDFQKWTEDLWLAVKYENFIFSFRNSLVADAYTKLCIQFNTWDWAFRKHMYSWLREAETKIANAELVSHGSWDSTQSEGLLQSLKIEGECELDKAEGQILLSLKDYYQRKKDHVYLVEMYKQDFVNSAKGLRLEIHNSIINKFETAMEIKKGKTKLEILTKSHSVAMEKQVWKLVDTCRQSSTEMREQQLEQEFEKTWIRTVAELPKTDLGRQNVVQDIYMQLRKSMAHSEAEARERAQTIIERSKQLVAEKVETKSDYHKTHAIDLLKLIDDALSPNVNAEFVASLKIHICGHASREFQRMHDTYIEDNDPRKSLERLKPQYLADFKDLFFERDQCKRKAEEFMRSCLTPAVREYINNSLGQEIVDDIEKGPTGIDFKARIFFQYAILKHLLLYDDFESFVNYISHYKEFVKHWIHNAILDHYITGDNSISYLEDKLLEVISQKIYAAIESKEKDILSAEHGGTEETHVCTFVRGICTYLNNELVIPKDALDAVLALNNADPKQFSDYLKSFVAQMVHFLKAEFHKAVDVKAKLERLPIKPQDELFQRLSGCGTLCPFCKAPCESDAKNHTTHFVTIHRPEGIGRYRWDHNAGLVPDICSSLIASNNKFQCKATENNWYPYKDFQEIYPNWRIQCDVDGQASDYWKYVLTKYNKKFAKRYKAKPAQIPPEWLSITQRQALSSLKKVYKVR